MANTPNLTLPYILPAQAQKHVTHNEAIRALDAIVQIAVTDRDLSAPPATPADGQRYIVAATASGAWAGQAGRIAAFQDGAWAFYAPREGWVAWVGDEDVLVAWNGTAWVTAGGGGATALNPAAGGMIGVNTTADATNRLAVKSNAVLMSHDDVTPGTGDMRAAVNKAATGNTASFLFQKGFSMRAEVGLVGSDDFAFKVSPDGATVRTPLLLKGDGTVSLQGLNPAGNVAIDISKERSAALSSRVQLGNIGGFYTDANGGAYWRGMHMFGPAGGVVFGGSTAFPNMVNYFEYDAATNPTVKRFVWAVGNNGGNYHDLVFHSEGVGDHLVLKSDRTQIARKLLPINDNAMSLGQSGLRFTEVWAANGTIQTSDARDKEVTGRLAHGTATALVDAISPVLFRWTEGGNELVDEVVQEGFSVKPDADDVNFDAARRVTATRVVARPGKRQHAGFLAQEVKAAMDDANVDFGAWGLEDKADPDSRQWLRPDQLIPVLWAALRETRAEVAALKARQRKQ